MHVAAAAAEGPAGRGRVVCGRTRVKGPGPGSTVHVASTSPCEVTGDSLGMKIEAWASDMYSADDRPPQRCPHLNPGPRAWEGVPRCGHRAV